MRAYIFILKTLLVVAISLNGRTSFTQQKGEVKFLVDNENGYFEILLDDTLLIKKYRDSITAGVHTAQVWSYGYDISELEFTVLPDTVTEVYVKLYRSDSYNAYEESYSKYRMQFHKSITLPVTLTLAFSITSGAFMLNAYDLKKKILIDMDNYSQTTFPDEIALIKERVESNNKKYNFNRTGYYVSGTLALLGVASSIYSGIKFKNNHTEPSYTRQSPFSEKMSLQFTGTGFAIQLKLG